MNAESNNPVQIYAAENAPEFDSSQRNLMLVAAFLPGIVQWE